METITYIVRVIIPDGKNKTVVEEEYVGTEYTTDENNNLIISHDGGLVVDIHNYNWVSIKPKS